MINKLSHIFLSSLYSFSGLVIAFFIAWIIMFKVDFLYSSFYDLLSIDETILEFGPQNYYKKGFELTSKDTHVSLFSDIVTAIHNDGAGLEKINYTYKNSENYEVTSTFLHQAEVIHLQDVSHLLNILMKVASCFFVVWCALLASLIYKKIPLPSFKSQLKSILLFLGSSLLVVVIIGPQKVFYWLHTVIFPAENQWFFYYQDSLMTTMMKAPILFAPISIMLVVLAVSIVIVMQLVIQKIRGFIS